MVEPAENRTGDDPQFPLFVGADCITFHGTAVALCRNTGSQTAVRSPGIVITNPFRQEPTEMPFAQRDHEIQTLASYGPDQSFTKCILRRRWRRSFQDLQTETLHSLLIQIRRENAVTIRDDWSSNTMRKRDKHAKQEIRFPSAERRAQAPR